MEFELEPKESYYLSYTDKIVTGSLIPSGTRGFVGSAVSGSNEYLGEFSLNEYYFKFFNQDYRSSNLRAVGVYNTNLIFYDTIMPSFIGIYLLNQGKLVAAKSEEKTWTAFSSGTYLTASASLETPVLKLLISTGGIVTSSLGETLTDGYWNCHVPFMNRYKNIPRILNQQNIVATGSHEDSLTAGGGLTYVVASSVTSSNNYVVCFTSGSNNGQFSVEAHWDELFYPTVNICLNSPGLATKVNLAAETSDNTMKSFFGTGVGSLIQRTTGSMTTYKFMHGTTIKGWKFGIMNGIPLTPRILFRRGKYGQFRDMLEPRIYTTTYNKITNTIDGPIQVSFISGSQDWLTSSDPTTLNPYDSGIYDGQLRVGQPFYDS